MLSFRNAFLILSLTFPPLLHPAALPQANAIENLQNKITQEQFSWVGCDIARFGYMQEITTIYEKETGVHINISGGGATKGIRATAGLMSDMGGTCRPALPHIYPGEESNTLFYPVAWDALVFITHKSNPVNNISLEQVRDILLGYTDNWKKLDGPDQTLIPVFRKQTQKGIFSGVGYMTRLMLFNNPKTTYTNKSIFFQSSNPVEKYVEETPFSFAVTGYTSAKLLDVKILQLGHVSPTKETIISGAYALFRPLYLVTPKETHRNIHNFISWICSNSGQQSLKDSGAICFNDGTLIKEKFLYWPENCVFQNAS